MEKFGVDSMPFQPSWESDGEVDPEEEIRREQAYIMPRVEAYRNNLTVLSQRHNLYCCAYGEEIYCYIPHGPGQMLSREPAIILESRQSSRGQSYCESQHGKTSGADHSINHITIGEFGDEEIVLCACRDGDIYAFYTNSVQHAIALSKEPPSAFFVENVGISAWGLAIHAKSRLIAVSSNYHEVTVFAFGLNPSSDTEYRAESPKHSGLVPSACYNVRDSMFDVEIPKSQHSMDEDAKSETENIPPTRSLSRRDIPKDAAGSVDRNNNFKFVISLRPNGHNLPSITFVDDSVGDAMSIVATDIRGNIWFLKVWEDECTGMHYPRQRKSGWGVLAVPSKMFLPTGTYLQTFGHSNLTFPEDPYTAQLHQPDCLLDITEGMSHVADGHLGASFTKAKSIIESNNRKSGDLEVDSLRRVEDRLEQIIEIANGDRSSESHAYDQLQDFLGSSVILQTDRHNARLLSAFGLSTVCRDIVRHDLVTGNLALPDENPWDHHRLHILAAVPSLSLVVVASQVGRVALLTITRRVLSSKEVTNTVSFRVERTLPQFERDENGNALIHGGSLLGMAIGPMQGSLRVRRYPGPKNYRLILHYVDHYVYSYQISRDFETQELKVEIF